MGDKLCSDELLLLMLDWELLQLLQLKLFAPSWLVWLLKALKRAAWLFLWCDAAGDDPRLLLFCWLKLISL